ncbi:hypothetical protein BMW24_010895 [Mycobacterium heckeshornense]|nr:hypothetical protein BMW24_010895 [Mycobacterium heckeshornense]
MAAVAARAGESGAGALSVISSLAPTAPTSSPATPSAGVVADDGSQRTRRKSEETYRARSSGWSQKGCIN